MRLLVLVSACLLFAACDVGAERLKNEANQFDCEPERERTERIPERAGCDVRGEACAREEAAREDPERSRAEYRAGAEAREIEEASRAVEREIAEPQSERASRDGCAESDVAARDEKTDADQVP